MECFMLWRGFHVRSSPDARSAKQPPLPSREGQGGGRPPSSHIRSTGHASLHGYRVPASALLSGPRRKIGKGAIFDTPNSTTLAPENSATAVRNTAPSSTQHILCVPTDSKVTDYLKRMRQQKMRKVQAAAQKGLTLRGREF
jgi:hypothetical protein